MKDLWIICGVSAWLAVACDGNNDMDISHSAGDIDITTNVEVTNHNTYLPGTTKREFYPVPILQPLVVERATVGKCPFAELPNSTASSSAQVLYGSRGKN